jgi:hypothetical protein
LEDDQPAAWGLDAVVEDSELRADPKLLDFVLDEKLCGLGERLLNLTDADDARAWIKQAVLDYSACHVVGFA